MDSKTLQAMLLELDFTHNDAAVYLSLLREGPCNAGPVIKSTRLHRNIVYTSLDHLIARKLVSEKTVKGRKRFTVSDPEILIHEYSNKSNLAKEAAREVQLLLPKRSQEITIHQGNEEFFNLLFTTMRQIPGNEVYVLGAGGKEFMEHTMLPMWDKYHREAARLKIKVNLVCYEEQRQSIEPHIRGMKMYDTRYLKDSAVNPAGIQFYPKLGVVFNIVYPDAANPVTVIRIKNSALTKGYLQLFKQLWRIGCR